MAEHCTHENCKVAETGSCLQGYAEIDECPNYVADRLEALLGESRRPETPQSAPSATAEGFVRSGMGLGMDEVEELQSRLHTDIIGVVGLPGTGKTSYLMGLYSLILNSKLLPEFAFSGSRTLPGFELRARGLRTWAKGELEAELVARTSKFVREPSFLHVSFLDASGHKPVSLLFSDVPGEWFERLIAKPTDIRGKLKFLDTCSGILLTVDGPAFAPPDKIHAASADLRHLLLRLQGELSKGGRSIPRVAVVITKCDAVTESQFESVQSAVRDVCHRCLQTFEVFKCAAASYHPDLLPVGTGVKESLLYLAQSANAAVMVEPNAAVIERTFHMASICNVQF